MEDNAVKKALQKVGWINRIVIRSKEREKRVSYGNENPGKTFFVIRRNAPNAGLYSFVLTNLGWMKYAVDKGYIPVVDMQSFYNTYLTHEQVGKVNAWEYYFEQPCSYSLSDIQKSRNVILSSINAPREAPLTGVEQNLEALQMWRAFAHQYLHFSPEVGRRILEQKKIFENHRVLGVLCRGTDYVGQRPSGHPVQPTAELVIRKSEEMMKKQGYDRIYLATEDREIFRKFQQSFGTCLCSNDNERYGDIGKQNLNEFSDLQSDSSGTPAQRHFQKGFDYAVTIGLLAECSGLVAGRVSGTYGALLQEKDYEDVYLFDLGLYE